MKYSEQTLQSWKASLSDSERKRAKNTINMIRSAIISSDELKTMDIEIFLQGSFANNTNVRTESDVDVCVMLKDNFYVNILNGKKRDDYGFTLSDNTFDQYRRMIKDAIEATFNAQNIIDGNNSLKIHENTYHVNADVVPAFQLRNYYSCNSTDPNKFIEGIRFISKDGKIVSNFPKQHKTNGIKKNNDTNYRYKKLVRIMKHIKNNMVDDGNTDGDIITSFLIECLIYNVPNSTITRYSTWTETIRQVIYFLYGAIKNGNHTGWYEVSELLDLFKERKWTDQDVLRWLYDAWNYLGYGK